MFWCLVVSYICKVINLQIYFIMKTFNFYQAFIILVFTFSLTSCTNETEFNQEENVSTFKIIPFTQNKNNIYTDNYKVSQQTSSIDLANDAINLEIPIPKGDFELINVYNVSSNNQAAILYQIGRNSTKVVVNDPTNFVIQDKTNISQLGLDTNLLQNGNGLRIFVINRNNELDTDSNLYNCILDKVENNDFDSSCSSNNKNESADGPDIFGDEIIMY